MIKVRACYLVSINPSIGSAGVKNKQVNGEVSIPCFQGKVYRSVIIVVLLIQTDNNHVLFLSHIAKPPPGKGSPS